MKNIWYAWKNSLDDSEIPSDNASANQCFFFRCYTENRAVRMLEDY